MSAFFVAINRSGTPFQAACAERMMGQLDVFGHDARRLVVKRQFALGYQSRWNVPEEVGEIQPLYDAELDQWFVFDGRVDNRASLIALLNDPELVNASDGLLLFRFCQQFGELGLAKVLGPFVFALFDARNNTLLTARDPMGGRYLCYAISDQFVLLATYEMAIVAHQGMHYRFNQEKVARTLTGDMDTVPTSTIEGITPLKPGELLNLSSLGVSFTRFYQSPQHSLGQHLSDVDYATEFRRLLTLAVERRMRSVGPVGTMLSGGLDSVPMTVAAQQVSSEPIVAFSWVFDEFPEVDERCYSAPICQKFGIEQVSIACDKLWPKLDTTTLTDPIYPFAIPYSEWQQATFQEAQKRGVKTILSGLDGDLLYGHTHTILFELVGMGRFSDAMRELLRMWQTTSSKKSLIKHYLLRPLPGMEKLLALRARRKQYNNSMLQPSINAKINVPPHWLSEPSRRALRAQQWRTVFDGFSGEDTALGRYLEAKFAIDRRYPFRDRELCEFMTSVPSDQLYFDGSTRPIVKRAFSNELGPELLSRNTKTNFNSVIRRGISEDQTNLQWFANASPQWAEYVKECYFDEQNHTNFAKLIIQWQCGYYDYWKSVCYTPIFCDLEQSKTDA